MTGSLYLGSARPGCSWLLVAPAGTALGLDGLHLFRRSRLGKLMRVARVPERTFFASLDRTTLGDTALASPTPA